MVDIDDTLVMHGLDKYIPGATYAKIIDPVYEGEFINLRINEPMVRLVREEIARGSKIFFWSRGGYEWAANVVKSLGFESEYDTEMIVMTKPFAYFDDSPIDKWMPDRVYLDPDKPYKK